MSLTIDFCGGYIVKPCRHLGHEPTPDVINNIFQQRLVQGSAIALNPSIANYFLNLFESSTETCKTDVRFSPTNGRQENSIRDEIRLLAFSTDSNVKDEAARRLAIHLGLASDHRSPVGLLIVISGKFGNKSRVAIFKFPTDESLQANYMSSQLVVDVIEGAFSRKTDYFKAAVFEDIETATSMWEGKVEDRQASQRVYDASELWLERFLNCLAAMKDVAATKILSKALKTLLAKTTDPELQEGIVGAAIALRNQRGRRLTMREFSESLPEEIREEFLSELGDSSYADALFTPDNGTLQKVLGRRTIVLHNQVQVNAPVSVFEDRNAIQITPPTDGNPETTIVVRGVKVSERLSTTNTR